jgi:hypothetical protein
MYKQSTALALCVVTLSACGTAPMGSFEETTVVTNNPDLNQLQGNWGRLASGPSVFRIQGENLIWFKGNKSYPLKMEGKVLTGTITDTRGITCQVAINAAGSDLAMAQKHCVDSSGSQITLAQSNATFSKVLAGKNYSDMSCEQLQTELTQLEVTIKQKDSQYQKLKTNNTAWAKEQRTRLASDGSYTIYRDISVISKQKSCPVTTQFDNPV